MNAVSMTELRAELANEISATCVSSLFFRILLAKITVMLRKLLTRRKKLLFTIEPVLFKKKND